MLNAVSVSKPPYRVIVGGGRHYADQRVVDATLDHVHARSRIDVVVHGDAPGADALAKAWAVSRGITQEPYAARWDQEGRAAGPIRNARMIAAGADLCVAFPGGAGTADLVAKATKSGIAVHAVC